jgi:uncharacterized protein DUF5906
MANDPFVIQSLVAYARRIDAEQINFRKYMVKTYFGNYYTEKVLITLAADGEITVTDEKFAPTDEEREAIRTEVAGITFPRSMKASDEDLLQLIPKLKSPIYELFRDPDPDSDYVHEQGGGGFDGSNLIVMVQERRERDDGGKYFLPWTFFNDNVWRRMEPDDKLPFWRPSLKPEEKRTRIMIHEGVKAAKAANRIVAKKEPHPWLSEMQLYEHWGAIGGALAPGRLDFAVLKKKKPSEVIYVCDNDFVGKSALAKVSKAYGEPLKGIEFDCRWPDAWDVADPIPKNFWRESDGRYIGPMLRELMKPATWATTWQSPRTPRGKPTIEIDMNFLQEWFHSVRPNAYVHRDFPDRVLSAKEFDDAMKPFSGLDSRSFVRLSSMMEGYSAIKVDELAYEPNLLPGVYHLNRRSVFNTHVPGNVLPEDIDPTPFLKYLEYMVPEARDRLEVMRWIATLIARPEVRIRYGLLLVSEQQGVGKGTLGEAILAPLVGKHNFSSPNETSLVDSSFNQWAAHKRLILCAEIYSGHSWKAYNKLKGLVTDNEIYINRKNMTEYMTSNWVHVVLCSNHLSALRLDFKDRRWLVPKLTDAVLPASYWTIFHKWLVEEGGLGAIRKWADDFLVKNEAVSTAASAPMTAAKEEMIIEGLSEDETLITTVLDRLIETHGEKVSVLDTAFVEAVKLVNNHRPSNGPRKTTIKPVDVRRVAKSFPDWFVMKTPIYCKEWNHCRNKSRLIVRNGELLMLSNDELRKQVKPIDLPSIIFDLMGNSI